MEFRAARDQPLGDQQIRRTARLVVMGLGLLTMALSWRYVTSMYQLLLFTGALVASTIWPIAMGLYWRQANRQAATAAMVLGSISGLLAYGLIAPYCAALVSAAVSAVVMGLGSHWTPERFDWRLLAGR